MRNTQAQVAAANKERVVFIAAEGRWLARAHFSRCPRWQDDPMALRGDQCHKKSPMPREGEPERRVVR